MSILSKYSKIISRSLDTTEVGELEQLLKQRNDELNEILIEEKEAIKQEDGLIKLISDYAEQVDKYSKYAQRAIATGDQDGGRRFVDKKFESEEKLEESQRRLKIINENKQKYNSLKNKVKNEISEIINKI
ncbi:MAG: hypothetical protein ACRC7N_10755 [Clostridium sp.]